MDAYMNLYHKYVSTRLSVPHVHGLESRVQEWHSCLAKNDANRRNEAGKIEPSLHG